MAEIILITIIVLVAFQDKNDHKTQYPPGTELQVEPERADDLIARGLAKLKEEPKTKAPAKPKKPAKDKTAQADQEDAAETDKGKGDAETGEESEVKEKEDDSTTGSKE